jgi:hypothetical protein
MVILLPNHGAALRYIIFSALLEHLYTICHCVPLTYASRVASHAFCHTLWVQMLKLLVTCCMLPCGLQV